MNLRICCEWLGFVEVIEIIFVFEFCMIHILHRSLIVQHVSFLRMIIKSSVWRNRIVLFEALRLLLASLKLSLFSLAIPDLALRWLLGYLWGWVTWLKSRIRLALKFIRLCLHHGKWFNATELGLPLWFKVADWPCQVPSRGDCVSIAGFHLVGRI